MVLLMGRFNLVEIGLSLFWMNGKWTCDVVADQRPDGYGDRALPVLNLFCAVMSAKPGEQYQTC